MADDILEMELEDDDLVTFCAEEQGCFFIRTQVVRAYTVSVGNERIPAASLREAEAGDAAPDVLSSASVFLSIVDIRKIRAASDIPRTVGATLKTLAMGERRTFCDRGDMGDLDLLREDDDDFRLLAFWSMLLLLLDLTAKNDACRLVGLELSFASTFLFRFFPPICRFFPPEDKLAGKTGRGRGTDTPVPPVIGGAGHLESSDRFTGLLRGDACGVAVGVTTAGKDLSEDTQDIGMGNGDGSKEEQSATDMAEAATKPDVRIP